MIKGITKKKYAAFSVDVEAFSDTGCISRLDGGAGDWDDMLDGLDRYMDMLDAHGIRATMFALASTVQSDGVAERLRRYISRGHCVALHGLRHTALDAMDVRRFREETALAKEILEKELGITVRGYRAPFFSLDNEKLEILREMGFCYDSSRMEYTGAQHNGRLDVSDFDEVMHGVFRKDGFLEFGVTCEKLFGFTVPISGGGYIRLCGPGWGAVRSMIGHYAKRENCYVFYLHPFEMSDRVPPCPDGLCRRDRYYLRHGLRSYAAKIEAIIKVLARAGFEFVTFDELSASLSPAMC